MLQDGKPRAKDIFILFGLLYSAEATHRLLAGIRQKLFGFLVKLSRFRLLRNRPSDSLSPWFIRRQVLLLNYTGLF